MNDVRRGFYSSTMPVRFDQADTPGGARVVSRLDDLPPPITIGSNRQPDIIELWAPNKQDRQRIRFTQDQWVEIGRLLTHYQSSRIAGGYIDELKQSLDEVSQLEEKLDQAINLIHSLGSFDRKCRLDTETANRLLGAIDEFAHPLRLHKADIEFSMIDNPNARRGRNRDLYVSVFVRDMAPVYEDAGGTVSHKESKEGKHSPFVRLCFALLREVPKECHARGFDESTVQSQVKAYVLHRRGKNGLK